MKTIAFLKTTKVLEPTSKALLYTAKPGNIVRMDDKEAKALIEDGNAVEYRGAFPPRFDNKDSKTKIKLKDLK